MKFITILLALFVCFAFSQDRQRYNQRPIIGIITQPSDYQGYPGTNYSYIAASYVKWIESAGARVVPIPYDADKKTLDHLFSSVNGLLFPGGGTLQGNNTFTYNSGYLFEKVIEANDKGDFFPLWSTCLGYEILHVVLAGYKDDALSTIQNEEQICHTIHFKHVNPRQTKLFRDIPEFLLESIQKADYLFYNHEFCLTDENYEQYPQFDKFFERTSYSRSPDGVEFIATVEARNYPIFGSQFHLEKSNFEWKVKANHTGLAVQVSQFFVDQFVDLARFNSHKFEDPVEETNKLIYNFEPLSRSDFDFSEIYFLPNFNSTLHEEIY